MILFWSKLLNYFYIIFFLFCSFLMGSAYSEDITGANTVNSTSNNHTTQKIFTVCDAFVDKVVDSEIVKDVASALNFF